MDSIDRECIERVQQGNQSEYLRIFDRYYARVESFARSQLRDIEAARDMASETFLRAFRNVDKFRLEEDITYLGYLLMICRRLIITERTRLSATPVRSLDEERTAETIPDSAPSPIAHLLDDEQAAMLQSALKELAEEDREIIQLAYIRDLSRRDIMHIMNKPTVSAVTSHLYRAMQKLKTVVSAQAYFDPERESGRR